MSSIGGCMQKISSQVQAEIYSDARYQNWPSR